MIKDTGKIPSAMKLDLFKKIIDDLEEFDKQLEFSGFIKMAEPLNKNFHHMIKYAKDSSKVEYIDTTTNASLLTHQRY